MNLIVTNDNIHLFLPGKVCLVSKIYAERNNCSIFEAMKKFYASVVYDKLKREESKYWQLGAVALYNEWIGG